MQDQVSSIPCAMFVCVNVIKDVFRYRKTKFPMDGIRKPYESVDSFTVKKLK